MGDLKLPKKTLMLWQIRVLALSLILAFIAFYFFFSIRIFIIIISVLAIIVGLLIFWYLPCYFKTFKLRLTNDGVIIRRGVVIKNSHFLPFSRLIYTQSFTTPLARLFKLRAITLKAARSSLTVPEFDKDIALELIENLSRGVRL